MILSIGPRHFFGVLFSCFNTFTVLPLVSVTVQDPATLCVTVDVYNLSMNDVLKE